MTSGQETEQVYSYSPGPRTGHTHQQLQSLIKPGFDSCRQPHESLVSPERAAGQNCFLVFVLFVCWRSNGTFSTNRLYRAIRPCLHPRSSSSTDYVLPRLRTKFGERAFSHTGPSAWNRLPEDIRAEPDIYYFYFYYLR